MQQYARERWEQRQMKYKKVVATQQEEVIEQHETEE
jgi:hypothetical protein